LTYANLTPRITNMALTKKQKQVYDYITQYQDENGIAPTQKEILEHFNLKSFGSVQRYLKYLREQGLLETDWNARRGIKVKEQRPENEIPLLGQVAAGNPIEAIEQADTFIQSPMHFLKGRGPFFALEVKGDSMINAGILEGDYIVCRHQKDANRGDIVVAVIEGEATVKTYQPSKNKIELIAENPKYNPIVVTAEQDFQLAGVLVGLVRTYPY
jgi:repressor LexA